MASTMPADETALEFRNVRKGFSAGRRTVAALQKVSLTVATGSIVALLGPDGAGKTTLLRLAAGLLLPDSGKINVFGFDSKDRVDDIHRLIGYMPQHFGLYEDLSVGENLDLYADLHGIPAKAKHERLKDLLRMAGLQPFVSRLAGRLSGGMKQKLGLACTLLSQPRLLLLDEPSVGVDPVSRRELWSIVAHQVKTAGMTVLLSTAYMDEAERCDAVLLLDQGEVLDFNGPDFFRNSMQGRCFLLSHPKLGNRELKKCLTGQAGIIDAVIHGRNVRVISGTTTITLPPALTDGESLVDLAPTEPRLEDAFIALLKGRRNTAALTPQTSTAPAAQDSNADEVIRVEQVDRWFGDFQAVKKLDFSVRRGEIFGLLGANGAGKTTTFRMLCGLLPASSGRLRVAGVDLRTAAAKARARIGYMSQKFSLYGNLSVQQNLDFFSSVYGLRSERRKKRIAWALRQFELEPDRDSISADLPLGFKQRLAMACALMHEPEVLFLDEPTSGVDPLARREFWERTESLAAAGVTVLVTTHFMEEAEYCDRLLIMVEGDILISGTPAEIKSRAGSSLRPDPTMEDAFIQLVEARSG
ncbi:ATP-binding cassette domain-containing protein [Methylomarinum vadi]|uniref:ATP-binding cassette domain-containing protein n=1 Tax=Methylomarinum vadi TaxID=438855 RepID=UPI001F42C2D5|nr:ATP-binding cassette domain-containing protein [Methylomarinum vadi]